MARSVRLTLETSSTTPCRVFFEPEGAEVGLPATETFTVEIRGGDESGPVEITHSPDALTVWAPAGAETLVWDSSGTQLSV
jgi:hypothetical protein